MSAEKPFQGPIDKGFVTRRRIEDFREILPLYHQGLGTLREHIHEVQPDGILVFGNSARWMVTDLKAQAPTQNNDLPPIHQVTSKHSKALNGAELREALRIVKKLDITFIRPLILEDFADSARKLLSLHETFSELDMDIPFAVLHATPRAKERLHSKGISLFTAVEPFNDDLLQMLRSRRTAGQEM